MKFQVGDKVRVIHSVYCIEVGTIMTVYGADNDHACYIVVDDKQGAWINERDLEEVK